jgi:hypothetical protein
MMRLWHDSKWQNDKMTERHIVTEQAAIYAVGQVGRWAVGQLGRWAVGQVGRWAGGQVGSWVGGQLGTFKNNLTFSKI